MGVYGVLVSGIPASYLVAGLLALKIRQVWRPPAVASSLAFSGSLVLAALAIVGHPRGTTDPSLLESLTLVLVTLLGWVTTRYSRTYLLGEPGQTRFVVALMCTLASVCAVVASRHLGVLILAWIASSISLHHLLTFYRDRAAAQIVAHKKFIASRLGEMCMLTAAGLIYWETGTLEFQSLATRIEALPHLPVALHAAAVLIALAVILKSAQLPVHGWLIQVMEAPTPVSALLHAGIVNIGGYVMIRLAEFMAAAPVAQAALVIVGSLTAALAGLVMMTRISIKVRLAWSTCAQMGFMLMECGLGFHELAYLHLVAHSVYKAYSFLSAGDTVMAARRRQLAPAVQSPAPGWLVLQRLLALPAALVLVLAVARIWRVALPNGGSAVMLGIVAAGLAPLLWGRTIRQWLAGAVAIAGLTQLYLLWHELSRNVAPPPSRSADHLGLAVWAGICLAALYMAQTWILAYPEGRFATKLYPWAYGGFYLDEFFTRLTFRIWPARRAGRPSAAITNAVLSRVEA